MKSVTHHYLSRLDHLRFLAALMVLFWHGLIYNSNVKTSDVSRWWPVNFAQEGHTGVALFMVLSGYIFWQLCRDREIAYGAFIRNRLLRIAPLFVFWMYIYFYTSDIDPSKLFLAIFSLLDRRTVPGNGWTIIVEFQFYLLFPFILLFSRKYGLKYLASLLLLAVAVRASLWLLHGTVQEIAYGTIFGRIDQFLLGMIACEIAHRKRSFFSSPFLLIGLVFIWAFVFHAFDRHGGYFNGEGGYPSTSSLWIYWPLLEGIFYAAIATAYIHVSIKVPGWLDNSLAWLGTLSFSLYLNQNFAIQTAGKFYKWAGLDSSGMNNAIIFTIACALPILIMSSAMTFYLIERPFLLMRSVYLKQRSPREGA